MIISWSSTISEAGVLADTSTISESESFSNVTNAAVMPLSADLIHGSSAVTGAVDDVEDVDSDDAEADESEVSDPQDARVRAAAATTVAVRAVRPHRGWRKDMIILLKK
jgi:hypothetical protein